MLVKSILNTIQQLSAARPPIAARIVLVIAAIFLYIRYKWQRYVDWAYLSIPLPAMEDYADKCKRSRFWHFLGAMALTPQEQLDAFERMGKPAYLKGRLIFMPLIITTNKQDLTIASTMRKAHILEVYRPFIGAAGILFQEGEKAKRERQMLNKGFGQQIYREIHHVMVKTGERMVDRMIEASNSPSQSFEVEGLVNRSALETISEAGFGIDLHGDENLGRQSALKQMLLLPGNPLCMLPFGTQLVEWWNKPTMQTVQSLLDETISKRMQDIAVSSDGKIDIEKNRDLLDLVISSSLDEQGRLDLNMMRDQVQLLFIGGSDTSSRTLHWALVLLAAYPEIQSKVREELMRVKSEVAEPFDRLAKLTYMDAFLKETLRMYTPVEGIARRLNDGEKDFRGIPIVDSKWTSVTYSSMMSHRRDDYFPNPDKFYTERWLDGGVDSRAFAAFSFGFRACLGRNFALTTMKTMISIVLDKHIVKPLNLDQPIPYLGFVGQLAAPVGDYPLRLEPASNSTTKIVKEA